MYDVWCIRARSIDVLQAISNEYKFLQKILFIFAQIIYNFWFFFGMKATW